MEEHPKIIQIVIFNEVWYNFFTIAKHKFFTYVAKIIWIVQTSSPWNSNIAETSAVILNKVKDARYQPKNALNIIDKKQK